MKFAHVISVLTLCLVTLISGCTDSNKTEKKPIAPPDRYEELNFDTELRFIGQNGAEKASISATLADTEEKRTLGLMDVRQLKSDEGMLFIFEDEQPRSFWMANTPLSLDIIFADTDGNIVRIHTYTEAYATENYVSQKPAKYVVEVNAGFTVSYDVQEGDVIEW